MPNEAQGFHAGSISRAENGGDAAAAVINPLLQTPGPPDEAIQKPEERTARAVQRKIRMGPKKLGLFMPLIRRRHIMDALTQCRVSVKKAARWSEKVALHPPRPPIPWSHVGQPQTFQQCAYS